MENNGNLMEKIDAFIKGHLSDAEKADFQKEILTNINLQNQVEQQKKQLSVLDILLEDDLRTKMKIWEIKTDKAEKKSKQKRKNWTIGLLTTTSLAALFYWSETRNKSFDQQTIIPSSVDSLKIHQPIKSKNAAPQPTKKIIPPTTKPTKPQKTDPTLVIAKPSDKEPIVYKSILNDLVINSDKDLESILSEMQNSTLKGDGDSNRMTVSDSILKMSLSLILDKKYDLAIEKLKPLTDKETQFTLAISEFLNGHYSESFTFFQPLSNDTGFIYQETSQYYAALSALFSGKRSLAIEILQKIANDPKNQFAEKANKVLGGIN